MSAGSRNIQNETSRFLLRFKPPELLFNAVEDQILKWGELFKENPAVLEELGRIWKDIPQITVQDREEGFAHVCLFCDFWNGLPHQIEESWKLLMLGEKMKDWMNPNILHGNYALTEMIPSCTIAKSHRFFYKKINLGKNVQGLAPSETAKNIPKNIQMGWWEVLQLLFLNDKLLLALDGDIYPFFDLANISLSNKVHEDLQRTLCVYTVGKCLVLDRSSTAYAREWNTQLLMKN